MPPITIGHHPNIYSQYHRLPLVIIQVSTTNTINYPWSPFKYLQSMPEYVIFCLVKYNMISDDVKKHFALIITSNQHWDIYRYKIQKTKHVILYTGRLVSYYNTVIIIAIISHGLMWRYPSSWSWTWAVTNLDAVLSHEGTMLHSSCRPLTISVMISLLQLVAGKIQEYLQRDSRQWQQGRRMGVHSNISGSWCSINISYQYRKSHRGDKTFVRTSYLHNGLYYSDKTAPPYSINLLFFISNRIRFIKIR